MPRDHPQTIKERIRRVLFACIISIIFINQVSSEPTTVSTKSAPLYKWLGVHLNSIALASVIPLFLFMTLFLGPLYLMVLEDGFNDFHPRKWKYYLSDLRYWRNYLVAPFSEELVFRGCMLPLLLPTFGAHSSIILAPSFFGIAHIHHAWEKYFKSRYPLGSVVLGTLFQAFYTTLFGGLSSWLFLRTGHLTSAVVSHAFCNMMGFPDFETALHHEYRISISVTFILGLIMFILFANPMTEPSIYHNVLYNETL